MKKEILYIWFGDVLPIYAKPTVEHTRRMNPTWDVKLVHYTKGNLENIESQNDEVLIKAYAEFLKAAQTYRKDNSLKMAYSFFVDNYKVEYIRESDHPVVYLDLDTICVDSFDNFFIAESVSLGSVYPIYPTWRVLENKKSYQNRNDLAVVTNIKKMSYNLSPILKDIDLSRPIINYYGFIMNEDQKHVYDETSKAFHLGQIDFSTYEPRVNKQLSPIEHYYSWERNELTENKVAV